VLLGRDGLFALTGQLTGLDMAEDFHPRATFRGCPPVVLVEGWRGTGKSAALARIAYSYGKRVPRAHRDLADDRYADTAQVLPDNGLLRLLRDLKWDLEFHVRHNGRLRFPRLNVALLAIETLRPGWRSSTEITLDQARKQLMAGSDAVAEIAHNESSWARDWLNDVLSDISGSVAPFPVDVFVKATVKAFLERTLSGSRTRREPLTWHERFDPRAPGDGYEALIMLSRDFTIGGDFRARAERRLVSAFLADLASAYSGPEWWIRAARPLVLLDNAGDRPAGRRFLRLVHDSRAAAEAQQQKSGPDPLVVVATVLDASRLAPEPGNGRTVTVPSDATAAGVPSLAGVAAVRVPLTPLDRGHVTDLLDGADHWRLPPNLARLIHRFTAGLPLGVDALTRAVSQAFPQDGRDPDADPPLDITGLLDLPIRPAGDHDDDDGTAGRDSTHRGATTGRNPAPSRFGAVGAGSPTVAAFLLDKLIPDPVWRARLTLLSCARDVDEAAALVAAHLSADAGPGTVTAAEDLLRSNGWSAAPGPFVRDAFLRALLMHQLGTAGAPVVGAPVVEATGAGTPVSGAVAHATLRDYYGADSSGLLSAGEPMRLYHCLAIGDAAYVAGRLDASFAESDATNWLAALVSVCGAPRGGGRSPDRRPAVALGDADDQARDAVYRSVNRLLHAAWYASDPLVGPDNGRSSEVIGKLERELDYLATQHPRGNRVLSRAARIWPARLLAWRQDYDPLTEGE
jgi:hypothetical protein